MTPERTAKKENLANKYPLILIFASGGGTNFQKIIDGVEGGGIDAEISGLICNNPNAYSLSRAKEHDISTQVISSKGKIKDLDKRADLEQEILFAVEDHSPQLIVLAGWMVVLSDQFVRKVNENGTRIINLHPALLTEGDEEMIETSVGLVPVIRGAHAIEEAFELNLPVSGVTVHEVVPGPYDTGRVILQEEVFRDFEDTLESWEAKIHEAEYRVLPQAINRILNG